MGNIERDERDRFPFYLIREDGDTMRVPDADREALAREVIALTQQLRGAVEALSEIAGGGYDDDHGKRRYYSQVDMRQIANRALDRLGGQ